MSKPVVHAIFPIPVYTVVCEDSMDLCHDYLNSNQDLISYGNNSAIFGHKSQDDCVLDRPECTKLKEFIVNNLETFSDQVMAWEDTEFKITQSWISYKNPGEYHASHYHPNSVLSGVYFFQDHADDVQPLTVHRPSILCQLMAQFAPDIDPAKNEHSGFTWAQFNIQPKKGLLVIFPSWLNHSVPENTTSALRKSLAFNSVPSNTVGSVFSSTKLTF
jgi:uncharacterized protein (TIGR02466 family)